MAAQLQVDGGAGQVELGPVTYADLTGDGVEEAVVEVSSGGTAGVIGYYVFTPGSGGLIRLLSRRDAGITVQVVDGRLVESRPVAAAGDPRCCPSQLRRTTFRWTGAALEPAATETVPNLNR